MMKNLASSFLSSSSTVVEYDLKQANSMQSGLIFNMAMNWFLHFKMGQVQPLLIQSMTGLLNLLYSPLFQVYVLGRNLQRPFPNPNLKKPPASEATEEDGRSASEAEVSSPSGQSAIEAATDDDDDEEEEKKDDEDDADVGEEESDDGDEESPEAGGSDSAHASDTKVESAVADAKEGDEDSGDDSTSDGSSDGE
jgi:Phosphate transport (Pho88)